MLWSNQTGPRLLCLSAGNRCPAPHKSKGTNQLAARTAREPFWSVPNNPLRQRGIITDADDDLARDAAPIYLIFSRDSFCRVIHQTVKNTEKPTSK